MFFIQNPRDLLVLSQNIRSGYKEMTINNIFPCFEIVFIKEINSNSKELHG